MSQAALGVKAPLTSVAEGDPLAADVVASRRRAMVHSLPPVKQPLRCARHPVLLGVTQRPALRAWLAAGHPNDGLQDAVRHQIAVAIQLNGWEAVEDE